MAKPMRWSLLLLLCVSLIRPVAAHAGSVTDKQDGFSIDCPSGWHSYAPPSSQPFDKVLLEGSHPGASGRTALMVQVFDAKGRSLQAYTYALRDFVVTRMGGRILQDMHVTVGGLPARRIVYTGNALDPKASQWRYSRTLLVHGDKLYAIHGVTSRQNFLWAGPQFIAIADSFHFDDNSVPIAAPGKKQARRVQSIAPIVPKASPSPPPPSPEQAPSPAPSRQH